MSTQKRVLVMGAGCSGLAAVKSCLEAGLRPVCLEKTLDIGGLWNYSPQPSSPGCAGIYESLVINTCREMMAFSDFPVPDTFPQFLTHRHVMRYFRLYAQHFRLLPHIRFNTEVRRVRKADDYDVTGKWVVTYVRHADVTCPMKCVSGEGECNVRDNDSANRGDQKETRSPIKCQEVKKSADGEMERPRETGMKDMNEFCREVEIGGEDRSVCQDKDIVHDTSRNAEIETGGACREVQIDGEKRPEYRVEDSVGETSSQLKRGVHIEGDNQPQRQEENNVGETSLQADKDVKIREENRCKSQTDADSLGEMSPEAEREAGGECRDTNFDGDNRFKRQKTEEDCVFSNRSPAAESEAGGDGACREVSEDSIVGDGSPEAESRAPEMEAKTCGGACREVSEEFDGVMVCSGHHTVPFVPEIKGSRSFTGRIVHSQDYKTSAPFADRTVLVIGIGNSAVDIASDLAKTARKVYLSTRRGSWIVGRTALWGMPADMVANSRVMAALPQSMLGWSVQKMANARMDHDKLGLTPSHKLLGAHPTINDEIPFHLMSGRVEVRCDVDHLLPDSVRFQDGSAHPVDDVILATGYDYRLDFVDPDVVQVSENRVGLYKFMFPPHLPHPSLAVVGLVQAIGAVMPISELQSRWFVSLLQGHVELPKASLMAEDVERKEREMGEQYYTSRRHTLQTPWVDYMDELGKEIGAKPDLGALMLTDPALALRCYLGPCLPAQYRLQGPHPWAPAADHIRRVGARSAACLPHTRDPALPPGGTRRRGGSGGGGREVVVGVGRTGGGEDDVGRDDDDDDEDDVGTGGDGDVRRDYKNDVGTAGDGDDVGRVESDVGRGEDDVNIVRDDVRRNGKGVAKTRRNDGRMVRDNVRLAGRDAETLRNEGRVTRDDVRLAGNDVGLVGEDVRLAGKDVRRRDPWATNQNETSTTGGTRRAEGEKRIKTDTEAKRRAEGEGAGGGGGGGEGWGSLLQSASSSVMKSSGVTVMIGGCCLLWWGWGWGWLL